jgi:hypothetical protein
VKNYYGYTITFIASELIPLVVDVQFIEIKEKDDMNHVTFTRAVKRRVDLLIDIPIKTSFYTFNVPLTFAMMAALFPFLRRRWRASAEAFIILLSVHILYVFSLEANNLATFFITRGLPIVGKTGLHVSQFLWQFTSTMVIRFGPFFIGFYIFLRFRK